MKRFVNGLILTALLAPLFSSFGQENVVLNYKGRLRVEGAPFSGTGYFMFVLEDKNGQIFWSSGDFPYAGAAVNPTNTLKIPVKAGDYVARLGASGTGMPPLNLADLRRIPNPRLKIWFNDGHHGWQLAGEDVPLDNLMASLDDAGKRPMSVAQGDAILQELREVRSALDRQNRAAQPAPPEPAPPAFATVNISGPSMGKSNAPLVMVEFTDYQCPFCRKFQETVLPDLVKKYVDSGQLRIVTRNLPLPFHQNAAPAALASLCANEQEKYWPMREKLFASNADLSATNILGAAGAVSLDLAKFKACLEKKTFEAAVQSDGKEANAAGITGTPSFVLGKPVGDKLNGLIIVGAQPLASFEAEIQKLLSAAK